MPLRVCLSVAVLKIIKTVIFSQAFLISIIFAKSILPYVDVLLDGILKYIVEPYFRLVWTSLTQWVFMYYVSVPVPLILSFCRFKGGCREVILHFCRNLSVLLVLIGLSQAFVLSLVVVSAVLQFLDQLISHLLFLIVLPYFNLLWSTLSSWLCVYSSVILIIFYKVIIPTKPLPTKHIQKSLCSKSSSEKSTESSAPIPFCPRQFFHIFNDKLCLDSLSDLCYVLMTVQGGFNLEESEIIDKLSDKREKLMKMLVLLEKKPNSQELLASALKYKIQTSEQRNWYNFLLKKVAENDPSTELLTVSRKKSPFKIVDTIFHVNHDDRYRTFGWPSFNDVIKFSLKKGWITAELIGSTNGFIVPNKSTIVSPVFRVYTSPDAQVQLEVSHSAKCASQLGFAVIDDSCMSEDVELKMNELLQSSFNSSCGILNLQQKYTKPCTGFIGCVVYNPEDPASISDSLVRTLKSISLPIQYTYSVFYELVCCANDLDFRRWRIHIIPHQDLSGFHEKIIQSKFKQQEYIYGNKTARAFEMTGAQLSLEVPNTSGSKWLLEQQTTVEENWNGIRYQHFSVEIQWTGKERTCLKDFKQTFEWIGTSRKATLPLFLSPRREYEALLQLHSTPSRMSSLKVLLRKMTHFTKAGIKLDVHGAY